MNMGQLEMKRPKKSGSTEYFIQYMTMREAIMNVKFERSA